MANTGARVERLAYRPGEAAEVLGLSKAYIYELITDGRIRATRIGRAILIPRDELIRVAERGAE